MLGESGQFRGQERLEDECIGYCIAYHSNNKILARNCLKTNPTWMQASFSYISSRSLPNLMIPGTHNSATYNKLLDKSVLQIINKYQLNQDESIFNQLVYGIRHLDLRIGYSKVKQRAERFWIYHDIFRTEVSAEEVFEQIKRFLELTSHEIVIMDIHRFTVGFQNENGAVQRERHSQLVDLIFDKLGNFIIPSYLGQYAPLNEYVAMGKRLLVGYAGRSSLLGSMAEQAALQLSAHNAAAHQVRDIDDVQQDHEQLAKVSMNDAFEQLSGRSETEDRRVGTRLYNRLKSLKLINKSFSKRSVEQRALNRTQPGLMKYTALDNLDDVSAEPGSTATSLARLALFFPPVRHLWPNKDTVEGLAQYMNDTTCRKYFGELRSMMVELTPTVFGAISDKYDGNRRLAQLVNRQVTDWIRDRWLHCLNIVASDYFLGNDLIRLSIYANRLRVIHRDVDLNAYGQCRSFRRIEHLLDKSKIPLQFAYHNKSLNRVGHGSSWSTESKDNDVITHTSSDGNKILLKPLTPSVHAHFFDKRDSFVDNISDGFTNLISSFKRLLNL